MKSTITTLFEALDRTPHAPENTAERARLLTEIDRCFAAAEFENSREAGELYQARCTRAIRSIHAYRGTAVRIWKFYSSGFVVKSGGVTAAFDLADGCTPVQSGHPTTLTMSEAVTTELASVCDIAFVTHEHPDHLGKKFCAELLRQGKTVVMPGSAIRSAGLDGAVAAESARLPRLHVYPGYQRMTEGRAFDVPCMAYLWETGTGKNILVKGDIFEGAEFQEIVNEIQKDGLTVDVMLSGGFCRSAPDIVGQLRESFRTFFVPAHEWEFSHRRFGAAGASTQTYAELFQTFADDIAAQKAAILSWGETIEIK